MVIGQREGTYVEGRVRAGVPEQVTTDLMHRLGIGARLMLERLIHGGTNLALDGQLFGIDRAALTGGSTVDVHGQQ